MYPPNTTLKLGKTKTVNTDDYDPWPPEDQVPALEVIYRMQKGRVSPELNRRWQRYHKI